MPPLEGGEDAKERNTAHNNQVTDPNIALGKQYENWKELKLGNKYHYSDSLFRNGEPNYTPSDHYSKSREVSKMLSQLLKQHRVPEVFQGILSNITSSWKYSRKWLRRKQKTPGEDPQV